jgi:hypothetical protein
MTLAAGTRLGPYEIVAHGRLSPGSARRQRFSESP